MLKDDADLSAVTGGSVIVNIVTINGDATRLGGNKA